MRWLLYLIIIVIAAMAVALLTGHHDGYVLIVRQPYRISISLNLLILLIVISFIAIHLSLRFFSYARLLPENVRQKRKQKRQKQGLSDLLASLYALINGEYKSAEKLASKAIDAKVEVGLSALIAARATHRLENKNQREYYLAKIEHEAPEKITARLLIQAEFFIEEKQYQQALNTLAKLEKISPQHAPALRLSLPALKSTHQWQSVLDNVQKLEKQKGLNPEKINAYRLEAHQALIKQISSNSDGLNHYWATLSKEETSNPALIQTIVPALIQTNDSKSAIKILLNSLKKQWNNTLVKLLGDCHFDDPNAILKQVEPWLNQHESNADLLYTLGKLCLSAKETNKAQTYLEASISVQPSLQAYLALAHIHEQSDNLDGALEYYKLAAKAISTDLPL